MRARDSLGVAIDAWRSARASVDHSIAPTGSSSLDQLASAGPFLLQQCYDSVAFFTAAVGFSCLAPHIHCDTVRHWFGAVKTFPAISLLLRVLSPGSTVCVARGGICLRSLHTAITPASPRTMTLFTIRCAQTLTTGVPWFLIRVSRPTFLGLGFRLWPLSSNPNFA